MPLLRILFDTILVLVTWLDYGFKFAQPKPEAEICNPYFR